MSGRIEAASLARRLVLMAGAGGFLASQISLMDKDWRFDPHASLLSVGGLAIWALALFVLIGPWIWGRDRHTRAVLDDELVRANRGKAFLVGYAAMMVTCLAAFVAAIAGDMHAAEAAHLIFSIGVAAPMFGFAVFERGA